MPAQRAAVVAKAEELRTVHAVQLAAEREAAREQAARVAKAALGKLLGRRCEFDKRHRTSSAMLHRSSCLC